MVDLSGRLLLDNIRLGWGSQHTASLECVCRPHHKLTQNLCLSILVLFKLLIIHRFNNRKRITKWTQKFRNSRSNFQFSLIPFQLCYSSFECRYVYPPHFQINLIPFQLCYSTFECRYVYPPQRSFLAAFICKLPHHHYITMVHWSSLEQQPPSSPWWCLSAFWESTLQKPLSKLHSHGSSKTFHRVL